MRREITSKNGTEQVHSDTTVTRETFRDVTSDTNGQKRGGRPRDGVKLVRKGNSPNWFIQFYDANGKTQRAATHAADYADAERVLVAWRQQHEPPPPPAEPRPKKSQRRPGLEVSIRPDRGTPLITGTVAGWRYRHRAHTDDIEAAQAEARNLEAEILRDFEELRPSIRARLLAIEKELIRLKLEGEYLARTSPSATALPTVRSGPLGSATQEAAPSTPRHPAKVVANQYVDRPARRAPHIDPVPSDKEHNPDFFARVRALRTAAGLSQAEVATALGISVQAYTHWEKHSPMPARAVPAFIELVGADYHYLLTGETR
jgi:DNA-binding XRE family transcriptional regulator